MANVAIRAMFAICGLENGPVIVNPGPDQFNINPAAQFVISSGIQDPDDLLKLVPDDIEGIVRMHNRRMPDAIVNGLVKKNMEALVYYARHRWRRQQPFQQAHWNADALARIVAIRQQVLAKKEDKSAEHIDPGPIIVGLGYKDWVGRFRNKLRSTIGAADVPLTYVIREEQADDWEPDPANPLEVDMYAMRLDGPEFTQDNNAVYTLLYNCCNHEKASGRKEALAWIDPFFDTQNGRAAFAAFRTHFEGEGPTSTRKIQAFAQLKSLEWKSESSMPFSKFSSQLKTAYYEVKDDAPYSDEHKVRHLLDKLKPVSNTQQMEVVKGRVRDTYLTNFDGAIAYIGGRIADLYADEVVKAQKYGDGGKRGRNIYEARSGRGHGGGRARTGGRGNTGRGGQRSAGRQGRGNNYNHGGGDAREQPIMFGGIDCTDPNRTFTRAEWNDIGICGRAFVNREREYQRERQNTVTGRGRGGRNYQQGGRMVQAVVVTQDDSQSTIADHTSVNSTGGRSGASFGQRAHGVGRGGGRY